MINALVGLKEEGYRQPGNGIRIKPEEELGGGVRVIPEVTREEAGTRRDEDRKEAQRDYGETEEGTPDIRRRTSVVQTGLGWLRRFSGVKGV